MKLDLNLRTINLGLVVILILVMGNQLGLDLPLGKVKLPVTVGDVVLGLAVIGVVLRIVSRKGRGTRLPPLAAFALIAAACATLARSGSRPEAAREILQLIEYFLVAFAVFLNAAEPGDLKLLLAAFAAATGIIILWAGVQYLACDSALNVRAGFVNRNALGAYLAMALPLLYGVALYVPCWGTRLLLLVLVAAGLAANLSGGAVLATLVALGVLSALRGQRALVPCLAVLGIAVFAAPKILPRPYHADILRSSVAPYVRDNFLLGDKALFARASELSKAAREAMAKSREAGDLQVPGRLAEARQALAEAEERLQLSEADKKAYEKIVLELDKVREVQPPRDLFDAKFLMEFLRQRRGGDRGLTAEQRALYGELQAETARAAELFPDAARASAFTENRVAVRYQRWHAAIACARKLAENPLSALFGVGYGDYHAAIEQFRPEAKLQYFSNVPEVFNVATSEPFTHDIWLKALVQTGLVGLLALAWLVVGFLGRAGRLYGEAHSELALGVALGAAGGILGFALAGVFSETVARGLAIPFVFLCALVVLAERIVRGEGGRRLDQLKPSDY